MYYGIISTTFSTGTQNVRRPGFPSSVYFKNDPNEFLCANKFESFSFPVVPISILEYKENRVNCNFKKECRNTAFYT